MLRSRALLALLLMTGLVLGACNREEPLPEYETFTSEEGRFSADFPGTPQRQARTETAGDLVLSLIHFTVDSGREAVSVSYIDYPSVLAEQDPQALLDGIAEGAATAATGEIEGVESELVSKTPASFQGNPAIDFEVDIEDRRLEARALLVGSRMYLLQVVSEPEVTASSYDRLVESFSLL